MTYRTAIGYCTLASFLAIASLHADTPIAPAPREVGGKFQNSDPEVIIARIVTNSNAASDRLSKADPGPETQKTQAEILNDIELLLKQTPGNNGSNNQVQSNTVQQRKSNESDPTGGMKTMPNNKQGMSNLEPMPNVNPMKVQDPMTSANPQSASRRPRAGNQNQMATKPPMSEQGGDQKRPDVPESEPMSKSGGMEPMKDKEPLPGSNNPMAAKDQQKSDTNAVNPAGDLPKNPNGVGSTIPLDEDTAKKVWGGPRDQMRKQVDQYYNERFMPGYSTLLKGYYAHLAGSSDKK